GEVSAAALVVTNAFGDVRDHAGRILAGARASDGKFLDSARILAEEPQRLAQLRSEAAMRNTTLAVVATNVALDRFQISALAQSAAAGIYRRITPAGTPFDGDVVIALCPHSGASAFPVQVETLAAAALEDAI